MNNKGPKLLFELLGITAIIGLPLAVDLLRTFSRVDSCLDAGGCFAYREWRCEYSDNALCSGPIRFLPPHHRWLPVATASVWLAGTSAFVLGRLKPRIRSEPHSQSGSIT